MTEDELARAHALVDELFGQPDAAANRVVDVIHAQAAALKWVRRALGQPTPAPVAEHLNEVAAPLRTGADSRDPVIVLGQAAVDAVAAYRSRSAA